MRIYPPRLVKAWVDYDSINPICREHNLRGGIEGAVTIPRGKGEYRIDPPECYGASLLAFVHLARRKGYRLVGANNLSYNAFFVRNDLVHPLLPEVAPASCITHPRARFLQERYLAEVQSFPWVNVG